MGRCLSPCLGDLDPNLYRRRLDEVLRLFVCDRRAASPAGRCSTTSSARCVRRPTEQRYERAACAAPAAAAARHRSSDRLGGVLEATHARPRLVLAAHPDGAAVRRFWMVGGRLVDWGPVGAGRHRARSRRGPSAALAAAAAPGELGAHVPPGEIDELRILSAWLASHPDTPQLALTSGAWTRRAGGVRQLSARTAARRRRADLRRRRRSRLSRAAPRGARGRAPIGPSDGDWATLASATDRPALERRSHRPSRPALDSRSPRSWRFGLPR